MVPDDQVVGDGESGNGGSRVESGQRSGKRARRRGALAAATVTSAWWRPGRKHRRGWWYGVAAKHKDVVTRERATGDQLDHERGQRVGGIGGVDEDKAEFAGPSDGERRFAGAKEAGGCRR